jgi:endonuclease/exonuclease/phosphatase family metal-dependent hydrolase
MRKLSVLILVLTSFLCSGQSLKVMTYNIRFDNPADGVNQWANRKEKVVGLIKKYDPDIFGVQEALHHQLEDITTNLKDYTYVGVGRDDGKRKGEFSAIVFKKDRFEVLEQNTFWLSEKPEQPGSKSWDAAITRVATWALVNDKIMNRRFLVINTHFDHIGKEARKKSAELLKERATNLNFEVPIIITGDFNCTRDEEPYQVMTDSSLIELVDPASTQDGTFCNFEVNSMECRPIDYIFVTNEWQADAYTIIKDNDGKYYPSDHLPVIVTLSLTE